MELLRITMITIRTAWSQDPRMGTYRIMIKNCVFFLQHTSLENKKVAAPPSFESEGQTLLTRAQVTTTTKDLLQNQSKKAWLPLLNESPACQLNKWSKGFHSHQTNESQLYCITLIYPCCQSSLGHSEDNYAGKKKKNTVDPIFPTRYIFFFLGL